MTCYFKERVFWWLRGIRIFGVVEGEISLKVEVGEFRFVVFDDDGSKYIFCELDIFLCVLYVLIGRIFIIFIEVGIVICLFFR